MNSKTRRNYTSGRDQRKILKQDDQANRRRKLSKNAWKRQKRQIRRKQHAIASVMQYSYSTILLSFNSSNHLEIHSHSFALMVIQTSHGTKSMDHRFERRRAGPVCDESGFSFVQKLELQLVMNDVPIVFHCFSLLIPKQVFRLAAPYSAPTEENSQ